MTTTETYAFGGGTMTVLVPGAATDGAFAVLLVNKPAGNATPPHSHDAETELAYVLAGAIRVETEGRTETHMPGEFALLPPGRPHRLTNVDDGPACELLLCAPAVFDRYVAAVSRAAGRDDGFRPMTDDDKRRMEEAAPRFGLRLLGPASLHAPSHPPTEHTPERLDVLGTRIEVLARLGTADDDLVLLRMSMPPGQIVPLHRHADRECFFLLGGTLDVYTEGDGWQQVGPGQAKLIRPSQSHALRNAGPAPVHALIVTQVRLARFLATVGAPAVGADPLPPSARQLAAFADHIAAFGYWLAPPSDNAALGLPSQPQTPPGSGDASVAR